MTTEYEPGRIYSGVVSGKRRYVIYSITGGFYFITDDGYQNVALCDEFTDIRGPLVVLDLDRHYDRETILDALWTVKTPTAKRLADQIEEQTKPPLQIGWHEVRHGSTGAVMRWDGADWHYPSGGLSGTDWTSTHFIGKASGDE